MCILLLLEKRRYVSYVAYLNLFISYLLFSEVTVEAVRRSCVEYQMSGQLEVCVNEVNTIKKIANFFLGFSDAKVSIL